MKRKFRNYKNRVNQINSLDKRCPICNSKLKHTIVIYNDDCGSCHRYYCKNFYIEDSKCLFECIFKIQPEKYTTLISSDIWNISDDVVALSFYKGVIYIAINDRHDFKVELENNEISIKNIVSIYNKYINNLNIM